MTHDITLAAGIDAAKDKLDIAITGSAEPFTVANAAAGWRQLAKRLAAVGVKRAGIEASGGYERGVVDHLRAAGFTVAVLQPVQVKAWARLHLRRAKNDRIDAALIAACAALIDPPAREPDARLAALADHLTFIEQIEEDIVRLKTRLEQLRPPRLRCLASREITRLQRRHEAELAACLSPSSATMISRPASNSCSASPASASAPPWPFSFVCPNWARSAVNRPPHWPAWRRSTATAARIAGNAISPATLPLRRRPARRLPLEPHPHCPLSPPQAARQAAQSRPRRLRQQTAHLCQYRRGAWHPLADTISYDLMVATGGGLAHWHMRQVPAIFCAGFISDFLKSRTMPHQHLIKHRRENTLLDF
jgi:hypothetical protein